MDRKTVKLSAVPRFLAVFCFALLFIVCLAVIRQSGAGAATSQEVKDSLQSELDQIEAQINDYRSKISQAQTQTKTLQREVQLLNDKIKQSELQIKQTDLAIQQTQISIDEKTNQIGEEEVKLNRERELLAGYLRDINEFDNGSMIELIFSQNKLSDVFSELSAIETIQQTTLETIAQIRNIKDSLETEKDDLSQKKDDELQLKGLQVIQRSALGLQKSEKNNLMAQTKGQESAFQKMLQKAKSDATEIKKQIYMLEGVGLSMTLEEAYTTPNLLPIARVFGRLFCWRF
jgi:septal ring factor EnvC (AmiA/AmiB activator)